jgi:hypothetical protein
MIGQPRDSTDDGGIRMLRGSAETLPFQPRLPPMATLIPGGWGARSCLGTPPCRRPHGTTPR